MSDSIFANVYRKVNVKRQPFFEPVLDERRMMQDQYAAENAAKIDRENAVLMENVRIKAEEQSRLEGKSYLPLMENLRTQAINGLAKELPDLLVGEAFADIYVNSLPLDRDYIYENYGAFLRLGRLYTEKLGGYDYLRKRASVTESTFLKKMADYISEASDKILKKKAEKVANAFDEKQVQEMINPKVPDADREKLLKKIDTLGADELSELVHQKVLDVVNDERRKNKQSQEFKDILKGDLDDTKMADDSSASGKEETNDLTEPTDDEGKEEENIGKKSARKAHPDNKSSKSKGGKKSDLDDLDDMDDDSDDDDTSKKSKGKDTKKKSSDKKSKGKDGLDSMDDDLDVKESFYGPTSLTEAYNVWNPVTSTFDYHPNQERRTLFKSIMENVLTGLIVGHAGRPVRKDPGELYNSPLNLVAIENLIIEKNRKPRGDFDDILEPSYVPTAEASQFTNTNAPRIDKDRVLSEALIQYTLLETAHTMRLIDVSPIDVAKQCEFLVTEYQ